MRLLSSSAPPSSPLPLSRKDRRAESETLIRSAEEAQRRMDNIVEGNDGLRRFIDQILPAFALSGRLPTTPPTYQDMSPIVLEAFLAEMEPDIRAADRDMREIGMLEQKGDTAAGNLPGPSYRRNASSPHLSDAPKPSSAQAIRALQDMGIDVNIMTGDDKDRAPQSPSISAPRLGGRMGPEGKGTDRSRTGWRRYQRALIGHVRCDRGGRHRADLLDVVAALDLSRVIFRTIRRNSLWACLHNILVAMGFLPLGLHLHPMMAGAMMAFSSCVDVGLVGGQALHAVYDQLLVEMRETV
ncbi:hypothetical protein EVG20_g8042 [Dentipellis fragilis]|uniref:Uncharacterized protein n=1 Tax=Dentipellis fragilis TaxID=205917 RepID=A0A4Y9Y9L7_9AGAM|nr:hypothetical protein EVG20_g8042 [Dentipellis fragilis]